MENQNPFAAFSEEQQKQYEEQIRQRYGDEKLKESQRNWGSYSADQKQKILEEGGAIYRDLAAAIPLGPASPQAQAGIARWRQHLRYFYEPEKEILLALGDRYVEDPEFAANFERIHPQLAEFMRQAIREYCLKLN